jgi:hypothetical protein
MRVTSCDAHSSVRPRESGDPGAKDTNGSKSGSPAFAKASAGQGLRSLSKPEGRRRAASAGTNGRCCVARIHIFSCQTALRLPARKQSFVQAKNIGPCSVAGRGDSPDFLSLFLPLESRGMARHKAHGPGYPGTGPELRKFPGEPGSPGPGREASRPAPCGAPTRHLGLYAFDRGRTGPGPSARRGCPSTARGRRLRLPPARRCRSRSPLARRLMRTPLVEWIGPKHNYAESEVKRYFHCWRIALW